MDKQGQEFWQNLIKQSRYTPVGIFLGTLISLWQPALPYLCFGALAGLLHFVIELAFYRKAHVFSFALYFFLYPILKGGAKYFYPTPDRSFCTAITLVFMFIAMYFGVRGLLQIGFRRIIVDRVGLHTAQNTS